LKMPISRHIYQLFIYQENFWEKQIPYLKYAVFWDVTPCGSCKN
jgi:hypothetical protein